MAVKPEKLNRYTATRRRGIPFEMPALGRITLARSLEAMRRQIEIAGRIRTANHWRGIASLAEVIAPPMPDQVTHIFR